MALGISIETKWSLNIYLRYENGNGGMRSMRAQSFWMRGPILIVALLLLQGCSITSHSFIVPSSTTESDWPVDQRECVNSAQKREIVPGMVGGTMYEVPVTDKDAYVVCMEKKGYKHDGWGWRTFKTAH